MNLTEGLDVQREEAAETVKSVKEHFSAIGRCLIRTALSNQFLGFSEQGVTSTDGSLSSDLGARGLKGFLRLVRPGGAKGIVVFNLNAVFSCAVEVDLQGIERVREGAKGDVTRPHTRR